MERLGVDVAADVRVQQQRLNSDPKINWPFTGVEERFSNT